MHSEHKPTCVVVVVDGTSMYHLDIDRLDEFKVDTEKQCIEFPCIDYNWPKGFSTKCLFYIYETEPYSFFINDHYVRFFGERNLEKVYWKIFNEVHDKVVKYQLSALE